MKVICIRPHGVGMEFKNGKDGNSASHAPLKERSMTGQNREICMKHESDGVGTL
ncbi:uncharacterized protein G2W53_002065 [Senna tora]|uniref:Uncharacterized protein n=1 Tax=Senna tora TaxID=362788 RepID=A0A835CM33_9FABA|nr:uncharacterized protein G2W53_002065 [Senna tora]